MRGYRIVAIRRELQRDGHPAVSRVLLDMPPIAWVSPIESVMGMWWYRAGGYPVGREFGRL